MNSKIDIFVGYYLKKGKEKKKIKKEIKRERKKRKKNPKVLFSKIKREL